MGKCFNKEIKNLNAVTSAAINSDVSEIVHFLRKADNTSLLCVGSGGSFSAAKTMEYLCIRSGMVARAVTPMELQQFNSQLGHVSVVFFSASGSNKDILNAFRYVAEYEPRAVLTCCMRKNSKIGKEKSNDAHCFKYEFEMPVKKDGFLAVESLISTIIIISKAMYIVTNNSFFDVLNGEIRWDQEPDDGGLLNDVLNNQTIMALHSGLTTPAAFDMESKFSEAALGNIQLADIRNFAHGRHFWLSNRKYSTAVVFLTDKRDSIIAKKTRELLPSQVSVYYEEFENDSIFGLLKSFWLVFHMVMKSGIINGIDPGKPKVEDFGKKLYHKSYKNDYRKQFDKKKSCIENGVYRKIRIRGGEIWDEYYDCGEEYYKNISRSLYKGIIFDYDGTLRNKAIPLSDEREVFIRLNNLLKNGVRIGIATGRGKSVRNELQSQIDRSFWELVIIAYYNGGVIGRLSDDSQPDKQGSNYPEAFKRFINYINKIGIFKEEQIDGVKDKNPYQLTLFFDDIESYFYKEVLREYIFDTPDLRLLFSDHSADIVPIDSRKTNLFKSFNKMGIRNDEIMCIGDSGQVGGNDYELLKKKNSLSVDYVSVDKDSCWNFAPPGYRNSVAMMYYFDQIKMEDNGFSIFR